MKVVINECFGGFSVSKEVYEIMGKEWNGYGFNDDRTDAKLIAAIEKIGCEKASGYCASLAIVDIPDNATDWTITEYDGYEEIVCVIDGKLVHLS